MFLSKLISISSCAIEPAIEWWDGYYSRRMRSIRRRRWNAMAGSSVAANAFIDDTAKLQFGPIADGRIIIHPRATIHDGVILATFGGSIEVGENVFIGPYCVLYGQGGISIGSHTLIASHTSIVAVNHRFHDPKCSIREQGYTNRGISIGEDVWVGTGVRVLDGVCIGKGCVVGAGAVVTQSLPELSIALGVPAKVVAMRGEKGVSA